MTYNHKKLLKKRELLIWLLIKRDKNKFLHLYNLLSDIIYLFETYEIVYWGIKGTLLGCIRNNSIIPWDDNINLCIFEKDTPKLYSEDFKKSINLLELNLISVNNEIILHKIKSRYFVKIMWIKDINFTLNQEPFGPLNIFIPSNHKQYLINYYGNKLSFNFGIITRSNSSGLLQKYINILKHYKVNIVVENKFLKYNPYDDSAKFNNNNLNIKDNNITIDKNINNQSLDNLSINSLNLDNLSVNSLDLDNLSVNSLDLDNLSIDNLNLDDFNYTNIIEKKYHNYKVVLYKLNNSINLVELKIISINP